MANMRHLSNSFCSRGGFCDNSLFNLDKSSDRMISRKELDSGGHMFRDWLRDSTAATTVMLVGMMEDCMKSEAWLHPYVLEQEVPRCCGVAALRVTSLPKLLTKVRHASNNNCKLPQIIPIGSTPGYPYETVIPTQPCNSRYCNFRAPSRYLCTLANE